MYIYIYIYIFIYVLINQQQQLPNGAFQKYVRRGGGEGDP